MKTCFDLASVALFDLLVRAGERRAASHVAKDQEHDVEAEEGVGHGSLLVATREPVNDAVDEQASANEAQNEDEEVHRSVPVDVALDGQEEQDGDASSDEGNEGDLEVEHSDLDLLFGRSKFRPLLLECVREHFLPSYGLLRFPLNRHRQLRRSRLVAIGDIAHVAVGRAAFLGEGFAAIVLQRKEVAFQVHAPLHHSVLCVSTPFGVVGLLYSRA